MSNSNQIHDSWVATIANFHDRLPEAEGLPEVTKRESLHHASELMVVSSPEQHIRWDEHFLRLVHSPNAAPKSAMIAATARKLYGFRSTPYKWYHCVRLANLHPFIYIFIKNINIL